MNSRSTIRCRFAPSPTGMLHVGGARTALFNYLFARSTGGSYLLRIEDSDRERSTDEALEAILNGLSWLGLEHDEEPYFQSKRFELYQERALQLLRSGDAYPCTATAEELDKMREQQRAAGEKPRYDGRCRPTEKSPSEARLPTGREEQPFSIRLRMPQEGSINYFDEILGEIQTPCSELDDYIVVRSDGTPTYNFVNAVDDIEMGITHVLRGNEHVANTPKQLAVYQALGVRPPIFAHFPLILGSDKKKLSKRHGATSVFEYRNDGYLPDAFVNYLARLGWSAGDQEIFTRQELEQAFSLKGVGKSPSVFDVEKLRWVNAEHIKACSLEELIERSSPYIAEVLAVDKERVAEMLARPAVRQLLAELQERSRTLVEIAQGMSRLFHSGDFEIVEKDRKKAFAAELLPAWQELLQTFEQQEEFKADQLELAFKEVLEKRQLSFGKLGQPLRLALSGEKGGVPLFMIMEALEKETSLSRLQSAEALFRQQA